MVRFKVHEQILVLIKVLLALDLVYLVVILIIVKCRMPILLGTVRGPTLDFWYHICVDIDMVKGRMVTAINGEVVSQGVKVGAGVRQEMAGQLQGRLVVGKWNYTFTRQEEQFQWVVTNLNIFKGSDSLDLVELTQDLCSIQGDHLAWSTSSWELTGAHIQVGEETTEAVCRQSTTYKLALGVVTSQEEAVATCNR